MTEAFEAFMGQSLKQGREYGDGYSSLHFENLSEMEEKQVLDLLLQRARLGDGVAIDGLAQLGTEAAHEGLVELTETFSPPSIEHVSVCEAIFRIAGAPIWQERILDDMATPDPLTRRRALAALANMSTPSSSKQIADLFTSWLSISEEETVRATASRGLMQMIGFPPLIDDQTPERLALERKLFNSRGAAIEATLIDARAICKGR